ncbi:protein of unknown function (plasmid) [Candidatus Methylocalor cossyra]|uniref:Reverse transcriptase domain-containing protein n=1 Tax=Candidatus Methylocalor cossyra TaxID=3108543 RepID=A0ABM9NN44_9GAMM
MSPLLANLFLHYAFDRWVTEHLRSVRFCRYADDGVVHCKSLAQAQLALRRIGERFSAVWVGVASGRHGSSTVRTSIDRGLSDDGVHVPGLYVSTAKGGG